MGRAAWGQPDPALAGYTGPGPPAGVGSGRGASEDAIPGPWEAGNSPYKSSGQSAAVLSHCPRAWTRLGLGRRDATPGH